MNAQKTRKSCEDYVEISRFPAKSLARAKTMIEELRVMKPDEIHVIQTGKTWEVVSYAYQPLDSINH